MDAGHLAAEFLGRFSRERRSLAAISLTDQTAAMTAIGNDFAFEVSPDRSRDSAAPVTSPSP